MLSKMLSLIGATSSEVLRAEDLRRGSVRALGTLECPQPLLSPINGEACAGFMYQASHLGWRTVGPSTRKTLTRALVYASPLMLRLGDGASVLLVPRQVEAFEPDGHHHLAEQDLPGFKANESLLEVGQTVRIHGTAKLSKEVWTIVFDQVVQT